MENNVILEPVLDNSVYDYFVGVKFHNNPRSYFFGITKDMVVKMDDMVVVETVRGVEIGTIVIEPISMNKYESELGLRPVLRVASDVDKRLNEINKKDAKFALEICRTEAERLNLKMNLISCEYTLDKAKVLFSYLADERVDFRELLKVLATKLHTRIELRQIGSRDKAKMIGGLGACGLPLCCSTFLNEFDGISIARAKNQMLAINIPKLSGHCGKLICCLKFEDEAYTEERKKYPELGSKIKIDEVEYTVTNINIVSGVIKVENQEDVKVMPYEDLKKLTKPAKKDLPLKERNEERPSQNQKENKNPNQNQSKDNRPNNNNRRDNNKENNPNVNRREQANNQDSNQNNNRNRDNRNFRHNNNRHGNNHQNPNQNNRNKQNEQK